ncbi:MAG: Plug domain-containing protein [Magnetococcales bacterium]|nr:Plug domain-containing protein [Magnetococcales bacterium]
MKRTQTPLQIACKPGENFRGHAHNMDRGLSVPLAILLMLTTLPAAAMTLIVTPGKSEQENSDIPASVSVLHKDDLVHRGIDDIDQAGRQFSNLHLMGQGTAGRSNYLFVRGVGSTHNDPAVGFLVDDVPMGNEGLFALDFLDVEQIELLRGPQGTLYGRNALGGVVQILSAPAASGPASIRFTGSTGNLGLHREVTQV